MKGLVTVKGKEIRALHERTEREGSFLQGTRGSVPGTKSVSVLTLASRRLKLREIDTTVCAAQSGILCFSDLS